MVIGTCGDNGFQPKARAFIPLNGLGKKKNDRKTVAGIWLIFVFMLLL